MSVMILIDIYANYFEPTCPLHDPHYYFLHDLLCFSRGNFYWQKVLR